MPSRSVPLLPAGPGLPGRWSPAATGWLDWSPPTAPTGWAWTCWHPRRRWCCWPSILGEERVAAEPQATAAVAEACGFLPLALRIAAANLLDQPQDSIADYVGRLRAGDRLAELAVDGDPQAAVGVAFDASYATLDPQARRLFRLLGLIPGPDVTAPAAAALTGMQVPQVEQLLDRLAGAHLVEPRAPGRFGFHDLLRLYARGRTEAEDERTRAAGGVGAAAGLVSAHRRRRLPAAVPDHGAAPAPSGHQPAAGPGVLRPRPGVGLAGRRTIRTWSPPSSTPPAMDRDPAAWLLADALHGYLWLGMYPVDWSAVAAPALAAAHAEGGPRAQSAAQLSLADLNLSPEPVPSRPSSDYSRALTLASRPAGCEGRGGRPRASSAWPTQQSGRLAEAADHHHRALTLESADRAPGWAGRQPWQPRPGLPGAGAPAGCLDQHPQALALFGKPATAAAEAPPWAGWAMTDHAWASSTRPRPCHAALAIQREVGDRGGEADTLRTLAGSLATPAASARLPGARRPPPRPWPVTPASVASRPTPSTPWPPSTDLGDVPAGRRPRTSRPWSSPGRPRAGYPEVGRAHRSGHRPPTPRPPRSGARLRRPGPTLARQAGYRLLEGQALTTLASIQLASRPAPSGHRSRPAGPGDPARHRPPPRPGPHPARPRPCAPPRRSGRRPAPLAAGTRPVHRARHARSRARPCPRSDLDRRSRPPVDGAQPSPPPSPAGQAPASPGADLDGIADQIE